MSAVVSVDGILRFRENKIVSDLLERHMDLNQIGTLYQRGMYSRDDWWQFLQLTGYSIDGFHDAIGSELDELKGDEDE